MHVLPSPRSQHQLSKCKNHRQTQYWRGVRKNYNTTNTFLFLLYKSIRVDLCLSFLSLSPLRTRTKKAEKQNKEREEMNKNFAGLGGLVVPVFKNCANIAQC